jgi:hypothetical protein
MANQVRNRSGLGESKAWNLPTPVPTGISWFVRAGLWVLNLFRASEQKIARDLSFISFLHWSIVKRRHFDAFNKDGTRPPNRLAYDCNLFLSTYSGPEIPYIEAFSDALAHGIDFVWGFSVGYPGSVPETTYFRYITLNQVDADHHYSAYPSSTVIEVRRCVALDQELRAFVESGARDLSDEHFQQAFRRLLLRVQNSLGSGRLP